LGKEEGNRKKRKNLRKPGKECFVRNITLLVLYSKNGLVADKGGPGETVSAV